MELEFDVTINSKALYDYMLYHSYMSPAGLLGTVAGAMMVVAYFMGASLLCLFAGIIVLAYMPWTLFLKSKQQMLANPAFKKPLHYRMTDEGIEVSQGQEAQMQKWDDMYKAVSTPKSLIVYTTKVNACIFPKKDLKELTPKVIEVISTHMPPNKVKIRG